MTRRELFRKTWRVLSGDLVVWAMLEVLFFGILLAGRLLMEGSGDGDLWMLLLPVPLMVLEMLLYHGRYFLDLGLLSFQTFSGDVTRVSRVQRRRCDDHVFLLFTEGPEGRPREFLLTGDLMQERHGELSRACSSGSVRLSPVSFRYLKRSGYIVQLCQWPCAEEPDLQREGHSGKWLKKQRRKRRKDQGGSALP